MRGLRAISQARASRSRRAWILVTTSVLSVAAVAAVVVSFGWRPVSSNQPAASKPAGATWSAPVLVLRKKWIEIDGTQLAETADWDDRPGVRRVDPVYDAMKKRRAEFLVHFPGREFPGEAIFQVEPEVSSAGVKSVFQTVAFAGFPNITFAVDAGREPR